MNISQAKEQVRRTCIAYLTTDEFGDYCMPVEAQRPIFLVGAPGIGKTAIMRQVAAELGLGLVDYSMTHHTRQSAIGLPLITKREFGGRTCDVSEYTMSEIIASVYGCIERTGRREGILFLDEINCVSETLAPAMLRFLQSKTFGNERVPDGWVIACAGNPVEYNRSAKSFDIATLDRVKRIEVEPDFEAWRMWAQQAETHPSVLGFLQGRPDAFYRIETKGRERAFVTARAWSDLSEMMQLYEKNGLPVDVELVEQYVQIPALAREFVVYHELFASFERRFSPAAILAGEASGLVGDATALGVDERLMLSEAVADALCVQAGNVNDEEAALMHVRDAVLRVRETGLVEPAEIAEALNGAADELEAALAARAELYRNSHHARQQLRGAVAKLHGLATTTAAGGSQAHAYLDAYRALVTEHNARAEEAVAAFDNGIRFVFSAFGESNEFAAFMVRVAGNQAASAFVARHGSEEFFAHDNVLKLEERVEELKKRLDQIYP